MTTIERQQSKHVGGGGGGVKKKVGRFDVTSKQLAIQNGGARWLL